MITEYPSLGERQPFSIEDVQQRIIGLQQFLLETTIRVPAAGGLCEAEQEEFELPEELHGGSLEARLINNAGPGLTQALGDPAQIHNALDSFLALEIIQRVDEDFGTNIAQPGQEFDRHGGEYLDAIFGGDDDLAAIKAARLVCSRAALGQSGQANLANHVVDVARVVKLTRGSGYKTERKSLWGDVTEILGAAYAKPYYGGQFENKHQFFETFMGSLGYSPLEISKAWKPAGKDKQQDDWLRQNTAAMLYLELEEPGLCRKITDVFGIRNFARYHRDMLIDMYRSRIEEPEKPYVLAFVANKDNNGAFATKGRQKKTLQDKLACQGIRYEEYECASTQDMLDVMDQAAKLHQSHGSEIVDVILETHGSPSGIRLGDAYAHDDGWVKSSDTGLFAGLSPIVRGEARIIITGCRTAKEEAGAMCVARAIAEAAQREVVASTGATHSRITAKTKAGLTRPEASFSSIRSDLIASPIVAIPLLGSLAFEPLAFAVGTSSNRRSILPKEQDACP